MGRRVTPAIKSNWHPAPAQPQAPAAVLIPPPAAALGEGALWWLLFTSPADTLPHGQPNVLQLEKTVSSSFLCKELQYEYISHMLTHKAVGALDPIIKITERDFPGGSVIKTWPSNAGGEGLIPSWELRSHVPCSQKN